eukprot:242191-Pelagomonas_calceolata.AAC.3
MARADHCAYRPWRVQTIVCVYSVSGRSPAWTLKKDLQRLSGTSSVAGLICGCLAPLVAATHLCWLDSGDSGESLGGNGTLEGTSTDLNTSSSSSNNQHQHNEENTFLLP